MWGVGLSSGEQQIPATQSVLPLYLALESGVIIAISRMLFLTPKLSLLFPYSNHKLYHWRTRGPQRLLATLILQPSAPALPLLQRQMQRFKRKCMQGSAIGSILILHL